MIAKRVVTKQSVSRGYNNYKLSVRAAVVQLWRGQSNLDEFVSSMIYLINRNMHIAWYEGALACGINRSELTIEEISEMRQMIDSQYQYISPFGQTIVENSRENKKKLGPLYRRAELWINRYGEVRNRAMQMACADQKLKWVWNPLKEHCSDCYHLNGKIHRASVWRKYDIRPKMSTLECGGWQCGCEFVPTDEPASRGRPLGKFLKS